MADMVEVLLPNGERVVRTSDNISEEELDYPMRCPGKNRKGSVCHCPMSPVRKNLPYKHIEFRQARDEIVHIFGCEYDKRRDKQIISCLNYRAVNEMPQDIWKAMSKKHNPKGKNKGKPVDPNGEGGGNVEGGRQDPEAKPILRKSKLPGSPEALAGVLLSLNVDDLYANTYVRDLILDERTVERFRRDGISNDTYVLVFAKKLARENRTFTANDFEFVVADCLYDASKEAEPYNCMQFRLSLCGKAWKTMHKYCKLKDKNTYIVIFSRWTVDPDNKNVYIAVDADNDHIGRIRLPDET